MKIIIGHTNMDLDCLGSVVLARYIYPEHVPVRSGLIHPVAKNLYNLYKNHLNFARPEDLAGQDIDHVVVVDTRSSQRVKEYFEYMPDFSGEIIVYDHHPSDTNDLKALEIHDGTYGSNTTMLGVKLIEAGTGISPEDATIALTGIYADTGNFTHDDAGWMDFKVASWLIEQGASLKLVREFLKPLREDHQISLFHDLLNRLIYRDINGHLVILSYMELETQINGLAAVVEKIFEVENADALFSVFYFRKKRSALIVGRSRSEAIVLNELLEPFGGGGHPMAASASIKKAGDDDIFERLEEHLIQNIEPAKRAHDIMSLSVEIIKEDWSLIDASRFLEGINHTGAPVLNEKNELCGFLSLRDIMKGRKAEQMHAPVKAFMSRNVHTGTKDMTLREIGHILYGYNIGHLPILEKGEIIGIVTRTDFLAHLSGVSVTE